MAALDTVQKYVTQARALLQDQSAPYRYSDQDLVTELNLAFLEGRRIRPDLMRAYFRTNEMPEYTTTDMATTAVAMDPQYRMSFVYYMCGKIQLRDEEENTDARAAAFLNKFTSQLLATQS